MNIQKQSDQSLLLPYEYIETEAYEKGFADYYKSRIVPLAEKYEAKRKTNRIKNRINITLAITTSFAAVVALAKTSLVAKSTSRKSGRILLLPPIFCWWFFVHRPKRKYFTALKNDVLPEILKFMGDFKYESSGNSFSYITAHHAEQAGILPFEDIISYKKEGINCKIFERAIWDLHKYSGTIYLALYFSGIIDLDFIIISKKLAQSFKRQNIGIAYGLNEAQKKLLENRHFDKEPVFINSKFEQYFDLYTITIEPNDGTYEKITAWLTDDFIDGLITLDNISGGKGIKFSIKYNQVLVKLMSTRNFFEVGISYNNITANAEEIKNLLKELNFTINFIDMINKKIRAIQPNN